MAYVEVTAKTDVWAVQEEIQWRLTAPYHHDGVDVNADPMSIAVISVGKHKAYTFKTLYSTHHSLMRTTN